jgi:hypothetical protein
MAKSKVEARVREQFVGRRRAVVPDADGNLL